MELPAKKSLGQHFLNSKHVLGQIISAAHLQRGQRVLEIGPGTGVLTQALLEAGANVLAIEKDNRSFELLKKKFTSEIASGWLQLVSGDVLEIRRSQEVQFLNSSQEARWGKNRQIPTLLPPYKVVANIPYYITGAILESFLEHQPRPTGMTILVQKEVADRIVAKDGKESVLSISVKAFGKPNIVAKVPRGAFTPPPKVDSAILTIENISDKHFVENNIDISSFFEILKAGFAHKRKFLKSNLRDLCRNKHASMLNQSFDCSDIWNDLSLDDNLRAENVSVETWLDITKSVCSHS